MDKSEPVDKRVKAEPTETSQGGAAAANTLRQAAPTEMSRGGTAAADVLRQAVGNGRPDVPSTIASESERDDRSEVFAVPPAGPLSQAAPLPFVPGNPASEHDGKHLSQHGENTAHGKGSGKGKKGDQDNEVSEWKAKVADIDCKGVR